MKCINKRKTALLFSLILVFLSLTGCSGKVPEYPYDINTNKNAFRFESNNSEMTAASFASGLCVVDNDGTISSSDNEIDTGSDSYGSAVLFDVKNSNTLYSRNAYAKLYPASMTKVLTAIVAMENCDMDKILTADDSCVITDNDVQKINLKAGDTMTLDQALHILLIYSANDVANMIAVNVGGSIEGFTSLMNAEAAKLGATNSNFANPNGLQDENHYTTAYDMYLIFNEAIKYDTFNEIIAMPSYTTTYKDKDGNDVAFKCDTTNRYIKGQYTAPSQITIIGGKTGTTLAAGSCLALLVKDSAGNPYISVVMHADNVDVLYKKTSSLLSLIS